MGVTSKMTRMVLLYTLILSMVSLPTNNYKLRTIPPPGANDYTWDPCKHFVGDPCGPLDYSESKGPKKNYKKIFTKITDDMKRQGKDYGGFTDFLKEAVEVVGPAWKVVGPALQKGMNAVMENLNKGSENSGKTEKDGQDYGRPPTGGSPRPSTPFGKGHLLRPGR